jgi:hypothetical protein
MMIANRKRSKRSSASLIESFSLIDRIEMSNRARSRQLRHQPPFEARGLWPTGPRTTKSRRVP